MNRIDLSPMIGAHNLRRRTVLTGFAMAAVMGPLGLGPARAEESWRLTSAAQPGLLRDHHVRIADAINRAGAGAVKAEFQFVASEQEALQQVVRGRLQVGVISVLGLASIAPEMAVFATPYLWNSPAEGDAVLDRHGMRLVAPILDAKGLVMLGMAETGFNDVVGKTPLLSPTDVKGRKIRVSPAASSSSSGVHWGPMACNCPWARCFRGSSRVSSRGPTCPLCTTSPPRQPRARRTSR